jgi:hypothetical protein
VTAQYVRIAAKAGLPEIITQHDWISLRVSADSILVGCEETTQCRLQAKGAKAIASNLIGPEWLRVIVLAQIKLSFSQAHRPENTFCSAATTSKKPPERSDVGNHLP